MISSTYLISIPSADHANIILRPTEAVREQIENSIATPGLEHHIRNAEKDFDGEFEWLFSFK